MIAIIINQCCCHQIFYIGHFIDDCVEIPNYQCQPSGTEPTPTTPQPTAINGNGLGAEAIVGIVIGSIIAFLILYVYVAAKLIFHNI